MVRLSFPSFPYPVYERIIPVLANYHLSVKKITRSSGRSSVAAAAYRSAELIYCGQPLPDRLQGSKFLVVTSITNSQLKFEHIT